jgi:hypothetical protein
MSLEPGPGAVLRVAADRLDALTRRTTAGDWSVTGLLATRPEVVARFPDGSSEHVAEARAGTAHWIAALSPAVAAPLAAWLRAAADAQSPDGAAHDFAVALLTRLPPHQTRQAERGP